MPRCYMVKKQSNKYQNWDQSDGAATVLEVPDSPTEGSTAPLCYTSLTNRSANRQRYDRDDYCVLIFTLSVGMFIITVLFCSFWMKADH
nr:unnamed protein product [Callosobruchus analis]